MGCLGIGSEREGAPRFSTQRLMRRGQDFWTTGGFTLGVRGAPGTQGGCMPDIRRFV